MYRGCIGLYDALPVPEQVEVFDEGRVAAWQEYHLSGMPELISASNLCHALIALARCGLLERLREAPAPTVDVLLEKIDARMGAGLLRYLTVRGVLQEWDGSYSLTPRGRLLTGDISLARLGFYMEAYGGVAARMAELLTNSARYGVDVQRAPGSLARHSGTVSTISYVPIVAAALEGNDARRIVDLGCGDGSLLVGLCRRDPAITGVGIDIAPEAIAEARRLAAASAVADRLTFEVADAFDPTTWPEECATADVVCGVGVLHEHFRDGDDAVIDILNHYASVVAGCKALLIGEPELLYDDRANDSDFFLVHVLTGQGIPRGRSAWLELFDRTQLRCERIYTTAVEGPRTCFYELVSRATA